MKFPTCVGTVPSVVVSIGTTVDLTLTCWLTAASAEECNSDDAAEVLMMFNAMDHPRCFRLPITARLLRWELFRSTPPQIIRTKFIQRQTDLLLLRASSGCPNTPSDAMWQRRNRFVFVRPGMKSKSIESTSTWRVQTS